MSIMAALVPCGLPPLSNGSTPSSPRGRSWNGRRDYANVISPLIDLTGAESLCATLAALHHRQRTGQGQYIDMAVQEGITSFLGDILLDYPMNHREPQPMGNRHPSMAPHGVYPCKEEDSWIFIAVGNDAEWHALCRSMGRPDMEDDPRFSDMFTRWHHQDELDAIIGEWTRQFNDIDLMHRLQAAGVAATASFSNKKLWESEHVKTRNLYREVVHPELGPQIVLGPPFTLPATPLEVERYVPLMDEHNREVFCGLLGLPEKEYDRLDERQVFN